jgi:xanthine dehydrogenase accessory factor
MGLDLEMLPPLLGTGAASIGVMGSDRRWATTRSELERRGVPTEHLDRVRSPIGLELQAETPEEIAIAIIAEIVGSRRGAF